MTASSSIPRGTGAPVAAGVRAFGRYALMQLIGKSERSMLWLARDPGGARDLMLAMPRTQPADQAALHEWLAHALRCARLAHPHLAAVVEIDSHEHWPFLAFDRSAGITLAEWLAAHPVPVPIDVARWMGQTLEALAFAHDAGLAHNDLQPHLLAISEQGQIRLLGLGVAELPGACNTYGAPLPPAHGSLDESARLRHQREAAQRDVLAAGVLLHNLLAGTPALDEPDIGRTIARLPPVGRELLRLPRLIPHPVPEPLRAIVNRAVSNQARQRYHSARTLLRALEGWRDAHERQGGGTEAMLLDRLHSVGHLPALPGVAERAARLALMERGRTTEMAEIVLQDIALSFELLRSVNTAHVHGAQVAGIGPVLTVRRAILMLGLAGVREATLALRPWPGPLDGHAADALRRLIDRVRLAGHVAQVIRPPGFDREVVFLVTLLQNLGRLLVQYHFADEADQIRQLMRPVASERPDQPEHPGLSEETAACAVLGADIESLGAAVARSWGLTDEVLHLIRRLPPTTPVRQADRDDDVIRATASCANEAVDVLELPALRQPAALEHVAHRYARALGVAAKDLQDALQRAHDHGSDLMDLDDGGPPTLSDIVTLSADLAVIRSASR